MTPQTFSLELCQNLSSLAPGFEGHWWWVMAWNKQEKIVCSQEEYYRRICPAWQVEDVLRNLTKLPGINVTKFNVARDVVCSEIVFHPDTAYQKIEEYLWSILK